LNAIASRITHIGHQPGAEAKIDERVDEFAAAGWTEDDLYGFGPYGYEGLAFRLRPGYDIGRIFEHAAELLCPQVAGRSRTFLVFSRREPMAMLLAKLGPNVYPQELRIRRYE
jgi:hypothetical protein